MLASATPSLSRGRDSDQASQSYVNAMQKKCRIDAILSLRFPNISRERIKSSIQTGNMTVNNVVRTKPSFVCNVGDLIHFCVPTPPEAVAEPENIPLDIFYEDCDVLVVNKAAGMPYPNHSGYYCPFCCILDAYPDKSEPHLEAVSA